MKKLALHWKILLGMLLGVIVGILMTNIDGGKGDCSRLGKTFWSNLY